MRYCPNCKKEVGKALSGGQAVLMVFLFLFMFPIGILYAIFHARKCPTCGTRTKRHAPNN